MPRPSAAAYSDEPRQESSRFCRPIEPPPLPSFALLGMTGSLPGTDNQNNSGGGNSTWPPPQFNLGGGAEYDSQPSFRKQVETVVIKRQTEITYKNGEPQCKQTETILKDSGSAEGNPMFQKEIDAMRQNSGLNRSQFGFQQPPIETPSEKKPETTRVQSDYTRQTDVDHDEPRQPRTQPGYQRMSDTNFDEYAGHPRDQATGQRQTGRGLPPRHPDVDYDKPREPHAQSGYQRMPDTNFNEHTGPLRGQFFGQKQSGLGLPPRRPDVDFDELKQPRAPSGYQRMPKTNFDEHTGSLRDQPAGQRQGLPPRSLDVDFDEPRKPYTFSGYQRMPDTNIDEYARSHRDRAAGQRQVGQGLPPRRPDVDFDEPRQSRALSSNQRMSDTNFEEDGYRERGPPHSQPPFQQAKAFNDGQYAQSRAPSNYLSKPDTNFGKDGYKESGPPQFQQAKAFNDKQYTQPRDTFDEARLPRSQPDIQQPEKGYQSSGPTRTQPSAQQLSEMTCKEQELPHRQTGYQQQADSPLNESGLVRDLVGNQHQNNTNLEQPNARRVLLPNQPGAFQAQQYGILPPSMAAAFQAPPPPPPVTQPPKWQQFPPERGAQRGKPGLLDQTVDDPRPDANILQLKPRASINLSKSMEVDFDLSHSVLSEPSFKEARDSIFSTPIRSAGLEPRESLLQRLRNIDDHLGNPGMVNNNYYSGNTEPGTGLSRGGFTATEPFRGGFRTNEPFRGRFQRRGFNTNFSQRGAPASQFQRGGASCGNQMGNFNTGNVTSGPESTSLQMDNVSTHFDGGQFSNYLNSGRARASSNRFQRGGGFVSQRGSIVSGPPTWSGPGSATSGFQRGGSTGSAPRKNSIPHEACSPDNPNMVALGPRRAKPAENGEREVEIIDLDGEESGTTTQTSTLPGRKRIVSGGAKSNSDPNQHCNICDVVFTSSAMAVQHYTSKNHVAKLLQGKSPAQTTAKANTAKEPPSKKSRPLEIDISKDGTNSDCSNQASGTTVNKPANHYCEVCNVQMNSDMQAKGHYAGKEHAKRAFKSRKPGARSGLEPVTVNDEELELIPGTELFVFKTIKGARDPAVKPQRTYRCTICGCNVYGDKSYNEHLAGERHKTNLKFKELKSAALAKCAEGETPPPLPIAFRCLVCRCNMFGITTVAQHRIGAKHMEKLKMKDIECNEEGLPMSAAADPALDGTIESSVAVDPYITEIDEVTYRLC